MKRKHYDLDEQELKLSKLLFSKQQEFENKINNETISDFSRKPAWIDDDDNVEYNKPQKKGAVSYRDNLKHKYETLLGTPDWAKFKNKFDIDVEDENDNDDIVRRVGHLQRAVKPTSIPSKNIYAKKLPRINYVTGNEGPIISCIEFHPKASVTLIAGQSGFVSLYSIGDDANKILHKFKAIRNVSAVHFSSDGSEAFIGSSSNNKICIYDVINAKLRNADLPKIMTHADVFQLSFDGKYIAVADGFEEIYILCAKSLELLKALKHDSAVVSAAFSQDSEQLYCYGKQGDVTVWDMSTFKAMKKFHDEGCITAACLTMSRCGRLLATGSAEGIVNVYETLSLTTALPLPLQTISNLRTKVTTLRFNPSTEILAAASNMCPNAVKLIHIPSYSVYQNFPQQTFKLGNVCTINFSPNSGYMALGNNTGWAYLNRLKFYKNY